MKDEREQLQAWAAGWKKTGELLEQINREEMREVSLPQTILALTDASESALLLYPPQPTSGLIEMQKIFRRLKSR